MREETIPNASACVPLHTLTLPCGRPIPRIGDTRPFEDPTLNVERLIGNEVCAPLCLYLITKFTSPANGGQTLDPFPLTATVSSTVDCALGQRHLLRGHFNPSYSRLVVSILIYQCTGTFSLPPDWSWHLPGQRRTAEYTVYCEIIFLPVSRSGNIGWGTQVWLCNGTNLARFYQQPLHPNRPTFELRSRVRVSSRMLSLPKNTPKPYQPSA